MSPVNQHWAQNNSTIEAFIGTHNNMAQYLEVLIKIPSSSPEIYYERQQLKLRLNFLKALIDILQYKHDINQEISLYQWHTYVQAANNIAEGRLTLKELLERPPIPQEGQNTVIADYVQRAIRKKPWIDQLGIEHYEEQNIPIDPNSSLTGSLKVDTEKVEKDIQREIQEERRQWDTFDETYEHKKD